MSVITIERKVLEKNDELARRNRELFAKQRTFVINLVSSPGSGKTSLLEKTLGYLKGKLKIAVIEGDVQTDLDAQRVARFDVPVAQIVTNGGCHLEAKLVADALDRLDLAGVELLVIENVGNLVCPSNYDLGEAMKVVVASTTEGDDKPLKYPAMFRNASVLIINKLDLLPYLDCDINALKRNALQINPSLTVFETSCRSGSGIPEWCAWLQQQVSKGYNVKPSTLT
ncbi:MAG TPA: hydrogenase accessory protein HypB [Bacteroidetes bacterium]|jgi:hydrogenase nickel incorporation protein HypB|nr:hydrogenase accessory protein HypB [Bacteroidota bacterium]